MVGELILDHDELSLPGLGTFVAEEVPASFSDRGYTVNPPYRKLSFYQRPEKDHLLVDFYAGSNGLSFEEASLIIARFLDEMKSVLKEKKVIVMPGLGRLRATRENNFFFVPDADLDIYPDGFGLRAVSMKNHTESRAQLSEAVGRLSGMLSETEALSGNAGTSPEAVEAVPDEVEAVLEAADALSGNAGTSPEAAEAEEVEIQGGGRTSEAVKRPEEDRRAEETAEAKSPVELTRTEVKTPVEAKEAEETAEEKSADKTPDRKTERKTRKGRKGLAGGLKVLLAAAAVLALALGGFLLLAHVAPEFIDSLLYTPEELEILNYPLS